MLDAGPGSGGGKRKARRPGRQDIRSARRGIRAAKSGNLTAQQLRDILENYKYSDKQKTLNRKDMETLARLRKVVKKKVGFSASEKGIQQTRGFANAFGAIEDWGRAATGKAIHGQGSKFSGDGRNNKGKPAKGGGGSKSSRGGRSGGRSGGGGGGNYSQPGMTYYGLGQFPGVSRKDARNMVRGDNNRLIRELLGEAKGVKRGMEYDINKGNALYRRTKGDLDYVFGEVDDFMQGQNTKISDRYGQTGDALRGIYSQLQGRQSSITDENRQRMLAEQQRLGIQQAGTGQFDQDAAYMQQVAAQQQANNMANHQTARNSSLEIGNLLRSMGQAEKASNLGKAGNDRNDFISETRQQGRGQMNDILGDIRGIRKDTPSQVNQLYLQMEQNAYQRFAEGQQADFNNQLAANNFNLDVSRLNSDNLWQKAKLRQEARRQAALRRSQSKQLDRQSRGISNDLSNLFR